MVQRKVIVRGATNQALDELDATDIPDLSAAYEAAGGIATHSADTTAVHGITDTSLLSTAAHVYSEVPAGTIDGANAAFTIAVTPIAGTLALYKNGLRQKAGAGNDYTLAAATITFLAGNIPLTGDTLLADYLT